MSHKPVVSIDVAKGKSVAAAFLSYNECVRKPFSFKHSPAEMTIILELLALLEQTTGVQPYVVLEATGIYSKPIVSFFSDRDYPVVVLNPLYTHQLKKKAMRKIKTDPIDTFRIAQAFYLGEGTVHRPNHQKTQELRVFCRQYYQWSDLFSEVQIQFRVVLDLLFPGYDKVFHKVYNAASLELLSTFSTPQEVLSADRNELLQILKQNRRGQTWNEQKVDHLLTIARESLPDSYAQGAHRVALHSYITMIRSYRVCLANIESQMLSLAESIDMFTLLRTIPGVGPITAAVIVAEIGDIKRFPSPKQLTAFAGLDSSIYESGTFKAKQNRITKRGSVYLRTALYQATVCGISEQIHGPRNPVLSRYYQQKRAEGKGAKSAIVATSHKLLRMIYGIWSSQTPFHAD